MPAGHLSDERGARSETSSSSAGRFVWDRIQLLGITLGSASDFESPGLLSHSWVFRNIEVPYLPSFSSQLGLALFYRA